MMHVGVIAGTWLASKAAAMGKVKALARDNGVEAEKPKTDGRYLSHIKVCFRVSVNSTRDQDNV